MGLIVACTLMFGWFDTGRYVADPRRQAQLFGPPPTAEDAIARLTNELATPNQHLTVPK
jgi:hypothetical protein